MISREQCEELDHGDPLAGVRERFVLPAGVIYLDGNSLGPPTAATAEGLHSFAVDQWAAHLIGGWNNDGWMAAPATLGALVAPWIGADADEVIVCDSTTVQLYKLIHAALTMRRDRRLIIAADDDFPTDMFLVDSIAAARDCRVLRIDPDDLAAFDDDLEDAALVLVSHVHYRSGALADMVAITARVHEHGALVLWDLSHSVGALPIDLHGCDADMAVGCTYKYLNGGPGAPAFAMVARRLHDQLAHPVTGWLGHAAPFAFEPTYRPAAGVAQLVTGTPSVTSNVALSFGLQAMVDIDVAVSRAKALQLVDTFVSVVESRLGEGAPALISPRRFVTGGNHVAFAHPDGYAIVQALVARGVIGDFRAPDVMRFGFAAAYLRHVDAFDAAMCLADVIESGTFRDARFQRGTNVVT
jgi:kynureninase